MDIEIPLAELVVVTNLDPMNRGLKLEARPRAAPGTGLRVTNLDPMNRGLKR